MLTLLVTVLATAYFVAPELLSRFILGFFLVRKAMNSPKGEELVRGSFWALIPLMLAWLTRNFLTLKMPPSAAESLQGVFAGLFSDKSFSDHTPEFFKSFAVFARANACLLVRAYFIVLVASIALGILTRKFGYFRSIVKRHSLCSKVLHWTILPRISEWHVALSPMLLDNPRQYVIEVDVMTKSGTLYRGAVHEKNIAGDGSLQTLILASPDRFLYADFLRDRSEYQKLEDKSAAKKPAVADYWRQIPGEMFLIVGSDIISVNVRHVGDTVSAVNPKEDDELIRLLKQLTDRLAHNPPLT
jgi:hypothetical protein